jgi:3-phenylpropionate/cinnamic acid dioxygenase small subunit
MRRMLSNIVMWRLQDGAFKIEANFVVYEYQNQSTMQLNVWPGRVEYHLRKADAGYRIFLKKVQLVLASGNLPTLSFII